MLSESASVGNVKKEAHNISMQELELKDAKWVTLNVIEYEDQEGARVNATSHFLQAFVRRHPEKEQFAVLKHRGDGK
jgi:hypothetical protein